MRQDRGECMWINPYTGKGVAYPGGRPAPSHYKPPALLVRSAVTGFVEYGAKHFCGRLRGELVTASYTGLRSFRIRLPPPSGAPAPPVVPAAEPVSPRELPVKLDPPPVSRALDLDEDLDLPDLLRQSSGKGRVEELWTTSGLTVVEDPYGQLIFPKITTREVVVLRLGFARLDSPERRAIAVHVGDHVARIIAIIQDHTIVCVVPPGPPDALFDVTVEVDGQVQRLRKAVKYMHV